MEENKSYKRQLVTFKLSVIQWLSVMLLIAPIALWLAIKWNTLELKIEIWQPIVFLLGYVILLILHELTHGLGYLLTGAKAKDIRFGMIARQGMLYCAYGKPLKASVYRFALILPLLLTGLIPYIVSLIWLDPVFAILFSFMISGAAGDVFMFTKSLSYDGGQLIQDHPIAPAFYLLYEEDKLPEGFVEVTEEDEANLNRLYASNKKRKDPNR